MEKDNIQIGRTKETIIDELELELFSISSFFGMGFIPKMEQLRLLPESFKEEYEKVRGERLPNIAFTIIIPEDEEIENNVIPIIKQDELPNFFAGIAFFERYVEKHNLKEHHDILSHAAREVPEPVLLGTPYEGMGITDMDEINVFMNTLLYEKGLYPEHVKNNENLMSYDEFKEYLHDAFSKIFFEAGYTVEYDVRQINDETKYDVIYIVNKNEEKESSISLGIRVAEAYDDYALGKSLGSIVADELNRIENSEEFYVQKVTEVMDIMEDYEDIKKRLIIRPINYNDNKKILEDHIYTKNGDIALVLYTLLSNDENGLATAKINRSLLTKWQVDKDEVMSLAMENTVKNYEPYISYFDFNTGKTEKYYFMKEEVRKKNTLGNVYQLGLENNINAATAVFYPNVLRTLAHIMKSDLYIMMIEVGFVMVHATSSISLNDFKEIIKREAKNTERKDFLTMNIYKYRRDERSIKMINLF
ncbi:MAG: DUF5688 family protein [Defluviitaleaceae bacterium]|nr:DUF5688 family protein [Defluviitaleaceae bacterium]